MSTDIQSAPQSRFGGQRWHDLDAVRAFALLSGVALHGVMSFMQPRVWIIADSQTSTGADVLFYVIHLFRMTLFFVLAGFFAAAMMQKKGVVAFAGNRLKRIALPLVIFWPICLAAIIAVAIVASAPAPGAPAAPAPPPPALSVATFPLTHLWFLYALLILYAGAIAVKLVTDLLHVGGVLGRLLDAVVAGLTRWDLITGLLALPVAAAFFFNKAWIMWFGIPTPDTGLIPNLAATAGFTTAFVFGWWLHRRADLLDHIASRTWMYGLGAVLGTWICLNLAGQTPGLVPVGGRDHWLYALVYPLTTWSWTFALVGGARLALKRENPMIRYLSDASYWIYIIHVPVLLVLQYLLRDIPGPVIGKFSGVLFGTVMFGLFTYGIMVRYTFIGTILNGRKRRAKRTALMEEVTA